MIKAYPNKEKQIISNADYLIRTIKNNIRYLSVRSMASLCLQ